MSVQRLTSGFIGLVAMGVAAGALAGFAARQHTYTVRQLSAHWQAPYDLVVFPRHHARSSRLIDPNTLDAAVGGITLAQYRTISRLPGVGIAAPLAPLGSISVPLADITVPPPRSEPPGLYRITLQQENQGLPAGQPLVGYYRYTGVNQAPAAELAGVETLYFVAIAPKAEARLVGLSRALTAGHYFTAKDTRPDAVVQTVPGSNAASTLYTFTVILTDVSPEAGRQVVTVTHLAVPKRLRGDLAHLIASSSYYGLSGPLGKLSGQVTDRAAFSYVTLWRDYIDTVFFGKQVRVLDGHPVHIQSTLTEGHNIFEEGGPLSLKRVRSPFPGRWPVALVVRPDVRLGRTGVDVLGEPFRNEIGSPPWDLAIRPIGLYNPARLRVVDDPLTHLPLVGYRPEMGQEGLSPGGRALNPPVRVLPDGSPVGLWTPAPEALVPLPAVRPLLGPAPISSIRIKVTGVRGLGAGGEARLVHVASEIRRATGLPVTIMRGSSPQQVLLHPESLPGFAPIGWIQTDWVRVGVSMAILRQVSLSQGVMLVPVLVAAALFAGTSAWLETEGDRRRWAVSLAVGVAPRTVSRQLIRQAGMRGLGVAVCAVITAGIVGQGHGLSLAAFVGFAAALLVMLVMVPVAHKLARQDPVRGLKAEPPASMAPRPVATGAQLFWALAAASWRRLCVATAVLLLPAAVGYGVGLVQVAWHDSLHITVLGQYLLVHGGWLMTLATLVTAAFTAVAAGELALMEVRRRQKTWAVGGALGWPGRVPAVAMAWEAGLVGLVAGMCGTGLAAVVLSPLFGVPVASGVAGVTLLGVMLVSEISVCPAQWARRRQDPVSVLKGV